MSRPRWPHRNLARMSTLDALPRRAVERLVNAIVGGGVGVRIAVFPIDPAGASGHPAAYVLVPHRRQLSAHEDRWRDEDCVPYAFSVGPALAALRRDTPSASSVALTVRCVHSRDHKPCVYVSALGGSSVPPPPPSPLAEAEAEAAHTAPSRADPDAPIVEHYTPEDVARTHERVRNALSAIQGVCGDDLTGEYARDDQRAHTVTYRVVGAREARLDAWWDIAYGYLGPSMELACAVHPGGGPPVYTLSCRADAAAAPVRTTRGIARKDGPAGADAGATMTVQLGARGEDYAPADEPIGPMDEDEDEGADDDLAAEDAVSEKQVATSRWRVAHGAYVAATTLAVTAASAAMSACVNDPAMIGQFCYGLL